MTDRHDRQHCAISVLPAQVRFFEVSEAELEDLRERFATGQYAIDIEHKTFSMAEYNEMLASECSAARSMCHMPVAHLHGLAAPLPAVELPCAPSSSSSSSPAHVGPAVVTHRHAARKDHGQQPLQPA
jgi:hypothetical protein